MLAEAKMRVASICGYACWQLSWWAKEGTPIPLFGLNRQQSSLFQGEWLFQEATDALQKGGRWRAVDDAMVNGQAQR